MLTSSNRLTYPAAAKTLGVSVATLHRLTARNDIAYYKVLKRVYFDPAHLQHWLERHRVPASREIA